LIELAVAAMRWRGFEEGVAEIDRSELSEMHRVQVLNVLGDPARNDLSAELAAACRAEASRRSPGGANA